MDIGTIISDAFHYPLKDFNKFIKLAIPNIIIGAIFGLILLTIGVGSVEESTAAIATAGILIILLIVLGFIAAIVDSGITLDIIRQTINHSQDLPELDIPGQFIGGIKLIITALIYSVIPGIIYLILLAIGIYSEQSAILLICMLIGIVIIILAEFLMVTAYGRLAETNKLSDIIDVQNIFEKTKQIGFLNIFIVLFITGLISSVVYLISTFIIFIPIIGMIIVMGILLSYIMMAESRAIGLLYLGQNNNQYNPNYHQFNTQYNQQNQISYPQNHIETNNPEQITYPENNIEANTQQQAENIQEQVNNTQQQPQANPNSKICPQCGKVNPEFVAMCINCGNKF